MRKRRVKSPSESLPDSSSPSQCPGSVAKASAATGSRRWRPMYTLSKSTNRAVRKRRAASARSAEVTLGEVTRASSPADAAGRVSGPLRRGGVLGPLGQHEGLHGRLVEAERGERTRAVLDLEQGEQDVARVDPVVVEPHGLAEGQLERLLRGGVEGDQGGDGGDRGRERCCERRAGVVERRDLCGDGSRGDVLGRAEHAQGQVPGGD